MKQPEITEEQAHEILRKAYRIQFSKESALRSLRLLDHRDNIRDPGEPVPQVFEPATTSKLKVFQLLKEIRKQVDWLNEEVRVQKLINMDANISPEILSLAEVIGVDTNV